MQQPGIPSKGNTDHTLGATELSGCMTIIKREMGGMRSVHSDPSLEDCVLSPGAVSEMALAF